MFDVSIREFPAQQVVSLAHQGSYLEIGKAFEPLFGWFAVRGLLGPKTRSIGIYYDDPNAIAESDLRSRAGIVVDTPPAIEPPFELTSVRAGTYAVLRHKGPYSDLRSAYQWLYGVWLKNSGRDVADAPLFEEYLNNPRDTPPSELLTDICLPLQ